MEVGQVAKHENLFEEAARWYRLARRRPARIAPSKMRDKLDGVARNARRLLKSLGVNSPAEASDGPGSRELLAALVLLGECNEDPIIQAVGRIGRLTEIIDGLAAAAELEVRAEKAAIEVMKVGKSTKCSALYRRAGPMLTKKCSKNRRIMPYRESTDQEPFQLEAATALSVAKDLR
jgi:hypothetical protein